MEPNKYPRYTIWLITVGLFFVLFNVKTFALPFLVGPASDCYVKIRYGKGMPTIGFPDSRPTKFIPVSRGIMKYRRSINDFTAFGADFYSYCRDDPQSPDYYMK